MTCFLYIGSSTQQGGGNRPEGIFIYRMDASRGDLVKLHDVESGPNPSFLAFHPAKRFLFCVNETIDGSASSFAVDPISGNLSFINRVKVGGDSPCYVTVDPSGRLLFIANYGSGSLSLIPVAEDGVLGDLVQLVRHEGSATHPKRRLACYDNTLGVMGVVILPGYDETLSVGGNPERQEQAHAHSIVLDPTFNFALAADLGMDRVWVYRFKNGRLSVNLPLTAGKFSGLLQEGSLMEWKEAGWINGNSDTTPIPEISPGCHHPMGGHNLKPGAGPRHIVFHPNGGFFYVSNELASTVTVFAWNGEVGCLTPLQNLSTLPEGFSVHNDVAHVALTPNGKFLYVSNRGHNSLAAFSVDSDTGLLTPIGHYPTLGEWPRNFCIDPDGRFLFAANQESGTVVVFAIDPITGALVPSGETITVPNPFFVTVVDLG